MKTHNSKRYIQAYEKLNTAQKKAVDSIDGPVMVLAGPGTGKTQILATRIGKILLETDTAPQDILALTFTESAAQNMRERVVSLIGQAGYYVNITTFHSFCKTIISQNPEYFPIDRDSENLSDLERYALFEDIIQTLPLKIIRPINRPLFYLRDIQQGITWLKREGVSVEDYRKLIDTSYEITSEMTKAERSRIEKNRKKNEELLLIYAEYQKRLRKQLRYDYEDMISLTNEAFEQNNDLLAQYQEKLLYFMVDEYQDTNASQNAVLMHLVSHWGEQANVFVVGDPNQAIYRFQGASVENVYGFLSTYPNAQVITLDKGYRCTQEIYSATHNLISNNSLGTLEGKSDLFLSSLLESQTDIQNSPTIYSTPSQLAELAWIATDIKKKMSAGIPASHIAVLYRTNAESEYFQEVFEDWGIPYDLQGGKSIFSLHEIQQLLTLLKLIELIRNGEGEAEFYEIGCQEWSPVSTVVMYALGQSAAKKRTSLFAVLDTDFKTVQNELSSYHDLTEAEYNDLITFQRNLKEWGVMDLQKPFLLVFEKLLNESGYLEWIYNHESKHELILAVNALFSEVKRLSKEQKSFSLSQFNTSIDLMQEHGISIVPEDLHLTKEAVHLSTAHKAKGQEWEYVYVASLFDGKWGNRRVIDLLPLPESILTHTDLSKKEQNEDERRLFYVAATRAKKALLCSYPESVISQNSVKEKLPSMFLTELGNFASKEQITFNAGDEEEIISAILQPTPKLSVTADQTEFFKRSVGNFSLSVTALNTYLKSPEEFLQKVLLRRPQIKAPPLAFGTAVHAALEFLYTKKQTGVVPSLEETQEALQRSLEKEILDKEEFSRRLEYGREVLATYYSSYFKSDAPTLFTEKSFGYGFSKTYLDDIHLVGRVDRVDWIDSQTKKVRVIDYKTGAAKSENAILGVSSTADYSERELSLPETIRGRYMRQLVFYTLLAQLDKSFPYDVAQAVFEFVEPTKQTGKITERRFTVSQEAVEDLKKLIIEVMQEVRTLAFLQE